MRDYLNQYINNRKLSDIGGREVSKVAKGSEDSVDTKDGEVSKVSKVPFDTFDTDQGVGYAENPAGNTEAVDALLAPACPVCGGALALAVEETDRYRYVQCPATPLDYFKVTNKRPGEPMGLFTTERLNDECRDCRMVATTYNGRCADCLARWCAEGSE
jgi:hypothetical protein